MALLRRVMRLAIENAGAARRLRAGSGRAVGGGRRGGQSARPIQSRRGHRRRGNGVRRRAQCDSRRRADGPRPRRGERSPPTNGFGDGYVAGAERNRCLCVPVSHHGRLSGILYLENNLAVDAFTPDRIEMMRVLAAQAAISLENARLYEDMKAEVERRSSAEDGLRDALGEVEALKNRLEAENVLSPGRDPHPAQLQRDRRQQPALLDALRRVERSRRRIPPC